jgi:hypothetical protein
MGSGSAVADPPADLDQKRREAEEGGEGEGGTAGEGAGEGEQHAEHEGEHPGEGAGEQAKPPLAVEGGGNLNSTIGGESPDKATVKLRGGSIEVAGGGQFKKGEVAHLLVKVRVGEVHLVDNEDRTTGEIIGTERRHIMRMIGVEKVPG